MQMEYRVVARGSGEITPSGDSFTEVHDVEKKKPSYKTPKLIASYSRKELAEAIRPHGSLAGYGDPGCGSCGCAGACGACGS